MSRIAILAEMLTDILSQKSWIKRRDQLILFSKLILEKDEIREICNQLSVSQIQQMFKISGPATSTILCKAYSLSELNHLLIQLGDGHLGILSHSVNLKRVPVPV